MLQSLILDGTRRFLGLCKRQEHADEEREQCARWASGNARELKFGKSWPFRNEEAYRSHFGS
ncbi:hypothetical protein ACPOL_4639 [Acidisarcina polymorpha]|uniref:Uncharacterized protein n=1 Tax=Acidisarcina polymorpha TaxID=2211140 RepID=A0A2Z5G4A6_9BACT|nr:hypothetical protein ACPOL_4639 [Acidisarcina polymorpha]